ncbi:MAG: DMT family transporter [Pirellulales bacterium]|nr:DMT family transporter [Pirellulales bacterium]
MHQSSSPSRCDSHPQPGTLDRDGVQRRDHDRQRPLPDQAGGTAKPRVILPEKPLRPPLGIVAGSACGVAAALLYTMANTALRHCVDVDPFLVSAVKAVPTVVILTPLLLWMLGTHQALATSYKTAPKFVVASFIGQLVGNGAFQIALGIIGLAASVPITLGVMIIGGAILGRLMLREPVSPRTLFAMITLIGAVVVLSLPGATEPPRQSSTSLPLWVGALCAAASGAAYAFFGASMRQTLIGGMSAPATMFISGVVGTLSLWTITMFRLGSEPLAMISIQQWVVMVAAGTFNFVAFAALSLALKALPVVAVNLINASQVAMAAVAGVMLFAEPITTPLMIGITLTFAGLIILASRRSANNGAANHSRRPRPS